MIGLIVYVFNRPNSFIAVFVSSVTGFVGSSGLFPPIVNNYVPDLVWAYALVFTLYVLIGVYKKDLKTVVIISVLFSVLIETLQLFQSKMFTFDVMDIVVEMVAIFLASVIIKLIEREEEL